MLLPVPLAISAFTPVSDGLRSGQGEARFSRGSEPNNAASKKRRSELDGFAILWYEWMNTI
jgi:hypothetical protein